MNENELRTKFAELQLIDQQMKQVQKQIQTLNQQQQDLKLIEESLEELKNTENGKEMFVPISSGIFVKAELKDSNELLVNVGSNIAVKKSVDESKKLIFNQGIELDSLKKQMLGQLEKLSGKAMEIEDVLIKAQQKK